MITDEYLYNFYTKGYNLPISENSEDEKDIRVEVNDE